MASNCQPERPNSTTCDSHPIRHALSSEKAYTNPADHNELKRVRWTASVTYVFRENVRNEEQ